MQTRPLAGRSLLRLPAAQNRVSLNFRRHATDAPALMGPPATQKYSRSAPFRCIGGTTMWPPSGAACCSVPGPGRLHSLARAAGGPAALKGRRLAVTWASTPCSCIAGQIDGIMAALAILVIYIRPLTSPRASPCRQARMARDSARRGYCPSALSGLGASGMLGKQRRC